MAKLYSVRNAHSTVLSTNNNGDATNAHVTIGETLRFAYNSTRIRLHASWNSLFVANNKTKKI